MRIYEVILVISHDDMTSDISSEILDNLNKAMTNMIDEDQYLILPPVDVTDSLAIIEEAEDGT